MARAQKKVGAYVLFYVPAGEPDTWARTDLWKSAADIPGVRVHEDREGAYSKMFGAYTSGQTFLYDPAGRLLFNGGITASRGHSGDNAGRDGIISLLTGEALAHTVTPAFGCSLRGE